MEILKRLGLALFLVLSLPHYTNAQTASELDPSQTYNTGNIVIPTTTSSGSTWVGGVYQDGVNCMGGGGPGYCGPNPIVRPDGNINFSYGSVYLYQEQLTAGLLPSGTGLQIRGYNFSFTAKNGSGWDDGRTDQLSALVRFWDTTNYKGADNLVYGNSWNLSYQFDWTNFSFSETFASPYDASTIGRVQYGFIGKDNNFWAGHYGPEIRDVSFNIQYGIDPCANDPLFASTCPGYLAALTALIPPTPEVVASSPVEQIASNTEVSAPVQIASTQTQQSSEPVQSIQQTSSASSAPQEEKKEKKEGASLSTILSIVRNEQDRIASVESKVVEAANEQAQQAANQVTENAEAVAQSASEQSSSSSLAMLTEAQNASSSQTNSMSNNSTTSQLSQQGPSASNDSQTASTTTSEMQTTPEPQKNTTTSTTTEIQTDFLGSGLVLPPQMFNMNSTVEFQETIKQQEFIRPQFNANIEVQVQTDSKFNIAQEYKPNSVVKQEEFSIMVEQSKQPEMFVAPQQSIEIEIPQVEGLKFTSMNPADDIIPKMPDIDQNQNSSTSTVNRPAQTNDLAVGVSLESLAVQPKGFNAYSIVLKDTAFYEPKEVYKGQKVVDNVRVLRSLSNDAKHQEMINQQYGR